MSKRVRVYTPEQLQHKREKGVEYYANSDKEAWIKRSWINRMWRNYKMTEEDYYILLADQGGTCANSGCGSDNDGKHFAVDHDHKCCSTEKTCGKCVRGLLCNRCNRMIGMVDDDTRFFIGLVEYLNRSTGNG